MLQLNRPKLKSCYSRTLHQRPELQTLCNFLFQFGRHFRCLARSSENMSPKKGTNPLVNKHSIGSLGCNIVQFCQLGKCNDQDHDPTEQQKKRRTGSHVPRRITTRYLLRSGVSCANGEQASSSIDVSVDVAYIGREPVILRGREER